MNGKKQGLAGWLRMRNIVALLLLIGAALAAGVVYRSSAARLRILQLAEKTGLYHGAEHELAAVRDEAGNILYWTCTMHPWVRAEGPGQCPV